MTWNRIAILVLVIPLLITPVTAGSKNSDVLYQTRRTPEVVTVGGPTAQISGFTSSAIQLAVDALVTRGGGTVRLSPGVFEMTGPVSLKTGIALEGAGPQTVLKKSEGFKTSFVVDADYGMYKVTVKDVGGLAPGVGIQLYDDKHNQGWDVTTAVVTAVDGNVVYLDHRTLNDYLAPENGVISNAFSLVQAVEAEDVRIANLTIDGNKATNDYINGCRGGGVYLHKARNCTIEGVHVKNFNGDSLSWQITEDIVVRNCEASEGKGLGFHPGTGSIRSRVLSNVSHDNAEDGFFLCWRVQYGEFRDNVSYRNGRFGISIGHQDTDNVFENNKVYENGSHGVCFRQETEENGGHRNTFRNNTIENNGIREEGDAYGFYVGGHTNDIVIEQNTIRSTGKGKQRAAVCLGPNAERVQVKNNTVAGHEELAKSSK